jgi:hypothetical protein
VVLIFLRNLGFGCEAVYLCTRVVAFAVGSSFLKGTVFCVEEVDVAVVTSAVGSSFPEGAFFCVEEAVLDDVEDDFTTCFKRKGRNFPLKKFLDAALGFSLVDFFLSDVFAGVTDCFGVVTDLGVITVFLGIADFSGDIKYGVVTDLGVVVVSLEDVEDFSGDIKGCSEEAAVSLGDVEDFSGDIKGCSEEATSECFGEVKSDCVDAVKVCCLGGFTAECFGDFRADSFGEGEANSFDEIGAECLRGALDKLFCSATSTSASTALLEAVAEAEALFNIFSLKLSAVSLFLGEENNGGRDPEIFFDFELPGVCSEFGDLKPRFCSLGLKTCCFGFKICCFGLKTCCLGLKICCFELKPCCCLGLKICCFCFKTCCLGLKICCFELKTFRLGLKICCFWLNMSSFTASVVDEL